MFIRLAIVAKLLFDLRIGNIHAPALRLAHLQLLVDELIEHFLARRRLLRGHLNKLAALLDVYGGDRLAVDEDNHVLRKGIADRGDDYQQRGGENPPDVKAGLICCVASSLSARLAVQSPPCFSIDASPAPKVSQSHLRTPCVSELLPNSEIPCVVAKLPIVRRPICIMTV